MPDFGDNPFSKLRRRIAAVLLDFALMEEVVGARVVQIFDRPLDIRGDLEESDTAALRAALLPGDATWDLAYSNGSAAFARNYTLMLHADTTSDIRPAEYVEWLAFKGVVFLYHGKMPGTDTPITDAAMDPAPLILDGIRVGNVDLERKLALEAEYEGWMAACEIVVSGTCPFEDVLSEIAP